MPAPILPSLFAYSRTGLVEISTNLADAVDTALINRRSDGPLPVGSPGDVLAAAANALGPAVLPDEGLGPKVALRKLTSVLMEHGIDLSHPLAAAHLQPPALAVAVAADALASASNGSLDTYDSGPSAIAIERWLIRVLIDLAGFGDRADGVMTPGGSLSNLLGLLLARDSAALRRGVNIRHDGVAALAGAVVFCSELAHFSVYRACAALGLGESAVYPLPTDEQRRIRPESLQEALEGMDSDRTPLAVVATAGTTDFGSIDPLPQIAEIAGEHGIWMHVDAAYGFGARFSDRLSTKLGGLEMADSVTLDLHKIGWQPAASSVLLVSDTTAFTALDRQVAYLNPTDDSDAGYDGLLGRSLQTTRRPDAVKTAATLIAYGRNGMGHMIDTCHDLARHAEQRIRAEDELELIAPVELTTVLFRYRTADPAAADALNGALRRRLLESGRALIGRTGVRLNGPDAPESVCLKFTLLNPMAKTTDIDVLVDSVLEAGRACTTHVEEVAT
ncbi:aminotransferase class V-fold PLP-dependent enzyme (plasmid) [Rhodococcus pyridinivorans]|uniref:Aminotransferase class V-fold PLP-dependent enzyme n=1 Tax=Rhodococcus pyridinivorans TaxID=103816 RepID=A0A7M2XXL8_9NOCA|nr:aminotransferase class V-fold PLP-dependent enzyme [Rhodococcus pyridinivorans]